MRKSEMVYTDFMKDIEAYLRSKFHGCPDHGILETSSYIATRATVMAHDLVRIACDRLTDDYRRELKRSKRKTYGVSEKVEEEVEE